MAPGHEVAGAFAAASPSDYNMALSRLRVFCARLRALALQDNVVLRSLSGFQSCREQVALPEMPTLVKQAGCMQPLRDAEDLAG